MDHLCQIASPQWTDKETKEYVKNCNTSFSVTKQNGQERVSYRQCAILNANALPVSIEEFMIKSGQRVMLQPTVKAYRSFAEYKEVQSAKKLWDKAHKGHKCISTNSFSNLKLAEEMSLAVNGN